MSLCRQTAVAVVVALAGLSVAHAEPQLWALNRARGNAATDSRFQNVVQYDLHFACAINTQINPTAGSPQVYTPRTAAAVGKRMAEEVIKRGWYRNGSTLDPRVALYITRFGFRGMPLSGGFQNYTESAADYPSLYFDATDSVTYPVTVGGVTTNYTDRGPWMYNGIQATQAWVSAFVAAYNGTSYLGMQAALPSRLLFDQERLPVTEDCTQSNWDRVVAYWQAITDPSNPYAATPLPGGSQTLASLWASECGINPTSYGVQADVIGGSSSNHEWYRWWRGVEYRVMGGAIKQAFIDQAAIAWPGVKGADYGLTVRTKGVVAINSLGCTGGVLYAPGDVGFAFPVEQDLTNCLNSLVLYPSATAGPWERFRVKSPLGVPGPGWSTDQRWRNTEDRFTSMYGLVANGYGSPRITSGDTVSLDGDEFWEESSLRLNRYAMDLCLRKNAGAVVGGQPATPLTGFITLPTQMFQFQGTLPTLQYDGLTSSSGRFAVRQSTYGLYRLLSTCRTHAVNEFMVWSDTSAKSADANVVWNAADLGNAGVDPDFPRNWNILRRAINLVYDYDAISATASAGSTRTVPSGTTVADCLRLEDEGADYDTIVGTGPSYDRRSVTVTSTAGTQAAEVAITFQKTRTSEPAPQFLNFEFVVHSYAAQGYAISFHDYSTGLPVAINSSPAFKDQDARVWSTPFGSLVNGGGRSRIKVRIPFQSLLLNSSGNQCKVYLSLKSGRGNPATVFHVDSAICYGSDEDLRMLCDLDGDGVVSLGVGGADTDMYAKLRNPVAGSDTRGRRLIDFNGDGNYDAADDAIWNNMITLYSSQLFDDYRQVGNDPRPRVAPIIP